MNYPQAYCVKCHNFIKTLDAHTVVLRNSSRALTGRCPKCKSKVYRILKPKLRLPPVPSPLPHPGSTISGRAAKSNIISLQTGYKIYPINPLRANSYCHNCDKKKLGVFTKGVLYHNKDRVLRGNCISCGNDMTIKLKKRTGNKGTDSSISAIYRKIIRGSSSPTINYLAPAAIFTIFLTIVIGIRYLVV